MDGQSDGFLAGRPALIVAHGPSSTCPDYRRVPADVAVVSTPWFFCEGSYRAGSRIDVLFAPDPDPAHDEALVEVVAEGRYRVGALATADANRIGAGEAGSGADRRARFAVELDAFARLAQHGALARRLMAGRRPSVALLALAFALAEGAREAYLVGFDAYVAASPRARFGRSRMLDRAERMSGQPALDGFGPQSVDQLDADLAFLADLLAAFPEVPVVTVGLAEGLQGLVPPARLDGRASLAEQPLPDQGVVKAVRRLSPERAAQVPLAEPVMPHAGDEDAVVFRHRNGKRCAFVTLVSGDYHHGARALARSLAKVSDIPLVVMCPPGADVAALARSGITTVEVPEIINPHTHFGATQSRFAATFTKLNAFRLDFLDRAVFVDSDAIVLRPIDHLFDLEGFWAVRDRDFARELPGFNSGVFAYAPDPAMFDDMMTRVHDLGCNDAGDQGFLNEYLDGDWHELPASYNATKRLFAAHPEMVRPADVHVLHYVGLKPWTLGAEHVQYDAVNQLWFDQLADFEARDLLRAWSRTGDQTSTGSGPSAPATAREAECLLKQGRAPEAITAAEADLRRHPGSVRALKALTRAHARSGDLPRAALFAARAGATIGVRLASRTRGGRR